MKNANLHGTLRRMETRKGERWAWSTRRIKGSWRRWSEVAVIFGLWTNNPEVKRSSIKNEFFRNLISPQLKITGLFIKAKLAITKIRTKKWGDQINERTTIWRGVVNQSFIVYHGGGILGSWIWDNCWRKGGGKWTTRCLNGLIESIIKLNPRNSIEWWQ